MKNKFVTTRGVVSLSKPYWSLGNPNSMVDVTFKPDDYNGWGISKAFDVDSVANFNQENAEHFAAVVEPKLRIDMPAVNHVEAAA